MPINKLLNLPYGSYLMVRLDYKIICGDELEAKIMRIIEMYMDDERRILYKELLNDPKNAIEPETTVEITKDVWAAISHRLFKNDLYDQDMSENTLKRALKSLVKKRFIRVRDDRSKRYEAPKYQINTEAVQAELDTLSKIGKTEYQKLMVSKIDGIKSSSHQNETPSDHQNLTVSPDLMVSNFDPNSRRVTDTVDRLVEEGTGNVASSLPTPAPQPYQPDFNASQEKPVQGDNPNGLHDTRFSGTLRDGGNTNPITNGNPQNTARHTGGTTLTECVAQGALASQEEPKAELSTLARTSPQASAKLAPASRRGRTPTAPKVDQAEVEVYLAVFDELYREVTGDSETGYGHTGVDRKAIIDDLLKPKLINPKFVTPEKLRAVYRHLFKKPKDEKTGFCWADNMSIKAVCRNYATEAMALTTQAQQAQAQKATQKPKEPTAIELLRAEQQRYAPQGAHA